MAGGGWLAVRGLFLGEGDCEVAEGGDARDMDRWFPDCVRSLSVLRCPLLAVRDSRLCCKVDAEVGVVCTSDPAPAGTPEALPGLVVEDREDATDAEDDGLLWNAAEEEEAMVTVVTIRDRQRYREGLTPGCESSDESCFLHCTSTCLK